MASLALLRQPTSITLARETLRAVVPRKAIMDVQEAIYDLPRANPHVDHGFAPGVYARAYHLPKGVVAAGRIHKHAHWNIILEGVVQVTTEEGVRVITAPAMFISPPGVKRIVYGIENTVWVTIHPTDKTDPDEIVNDVTVDSYEELDEFMKLTAPIEGELV